MKRFFSNLILAVMAFLGISAMAGNDLIAPGDWLFQLCFVFGGFFVASVSICILADRLASHLPDEEV